MAEENTPNPAAKEDTPSTSDATSADATQTQPSAKRAQKTAGEDDPPITEENVSVDRAAPDVVVENLHSTTVDQATEIPSANAPDPKAAAQEQEQTQPEKPAAKKAPAAKGDKPAAAKAAKKEKAPAVEDKPFAEFIQQHYLPALETALSKAGVENLKLDFAKEKVPVIGYNEECWQIIGRWQNGVSRNFNIYFPQENIQGQRAFSCYESSKPSTLEPFLIDERKVTLDLMIYGVMQRLNGQKWLQRN